MRCVSGEWVIMKCASSEWARCICYIRRVCLLGDIVYNTKGAMWGLNRVTANVCTSGILMHHQQPLCCCIFVDRF